MVEVRAEEKLWVWDEAALALRSTESVKALQLGTLYAEGVVLEAREGAGELGTLCFNLP